ncbi:AarF/ABC1/UbiB kinase family protein [Thalassotalea euphylliae]|uniref:AarF/ABC1/UbiB kinase family protein n=1 Tax=Thalassotalea euphylliae TaxID=1655234 RepID=A0A3E0TPN5_9GAMM|nr:AarF/ABC1/UbiB kinase family protein [Thalassotalea euphylliae]REL26509.1 AarF/ABC1/UbiB kinase family protein [Thalassotalea euphylliae]
MAKVATNAMVNGAKQLAQGESPTVKNLVLQPHNIRLLADKLAQMRGAAMKLGQLLSMDAGDLLPPELSQLLEKLRADAKPMPHKQLITVLKAQWGDNWLDNFSYFELQPFASASIGQVHLAHLETGEKLAVKVQYPGVATAIASDVDNVAALLKLSGLLPKHLQIDDLISEAKKQLLVEASYQAEASFMNRYTKLINNDGFCLPTVVKPLSNDAILTMNFIDGMPIENLRMAPQATRNKVVEQLIALFFRELFDFKLMQTDPNFANFLYQEEAQKIVLLDFGATRAIPGHISTGYLALINAAMCEDEQQMIASAKQLGFFTKDISDDYLAQILAIFKLASEPLVANDYDFATSNLAQRIKNQGMNIQRQKDQWHTPPVDAIFIHRKLAGIYLLATKLAAKVNVKALFIPHLE